MVIYQILAAVSAAALVLGWLYYRELQSHKKTRLTAEKRAMVQLCQMTTLDDEGAPQLWVYEQGNVSTVFNHVLVRDYDIYLMEEKEIKAKLSFDGHAEKDDFFESIGVFKLGKCPIENF
ncbi:hypothetical protein [Vibrio campbellii]|uniref:hypothetical protein n=1 Tax=Vibrio campbellii TaxID=680 RepID=UPI00210A9873|nr:hypothetical protein [Vibrio campbellii]UTZ44589.1 hypothetical protein HB764_25355 [Vibrio campbellii]